MTPPELPSPECSEDPTLSILWTGQKQPPAVLHLLTSYNVNEDQ